VVNNNCNEDVEPTYVTGSLMSLLVLGSVQPALPDITSSSSHHVTDLQLSYEVVKCSNLLLKSMDNPTPYCPDIAQAIFHN